MQKIAGIAEGANILINIGGLAVMSQLEAAAAAHFYASLPARRCMPAGEFIFGLGVSGEDPLVPEPDFKIEDGHVRPPTGPGFGISIDEKALEKYSLYKEVIS
jgi:L-alanine-DL-glutamate epimerase-like enolase superfamily enzyme